MNKIFIITLLQLAGGVHSLAISPADSITSSQHVIPDDTIQGITSDLDEFIITTIAPRKTLGFDKDGSISINARYISDQPSLLGSNDPMAFIKTLPSALTTNELQPGLLVRGSGHGANTFEVDGGRVINPMHMLGLYSAFNPSFYKSFSFIPGYFPATEQNATGGIVKALSTITPDSVFSGKINLGMVESNFGFQIPLRQNTSSLSIGFRKTYVNLLFPNILKLGKSTLNYGFTDINISYQMLLSDNDILKASLFMSNDNMSLDADKNGDVEGSFGWKNLAASTIWMHNRLTSTLAFSTFSNKFIIHEGGQSLNLPSSFLQATLIEEYQLKTLKFSTDLNFRHSSGQKNISLDNPPGNQTSNALEWNISASNNFSLSHNIDINAGIRLSFYNSGNFNSLFPLPRIRVNLRLPKYLTLHASYSRLARFDRLIEETTGGLPADFWTNASRNVRPEDVHAFEMGALGEIPYTGIIYTFDSYFKILRNSLEFDGAILELISPTFRPLDHIISGKGHAYGVSITASRQFGVLRGRLSYNFGRSRLRFDKYGDSMFPASFDRPHDLSATISWDIMPSLMVSANFTHATGTPYTAAKYGYIIGENLICEYFPHNSSRLPDYNRLDISAKWIFHSRGRIRHSLNLSIYNALASKNTLFIYSDYSIDKGIRNRKSEMKTVIPSLTYSLEL